ncbi:MAG: 4-(cytidine 5'-diphospho)-2-C-methyl-D-erythritol kinase [Candidatus Cloacimonetes bacterium]|nr:4-(cytidine 5'-diphospho)-2-C-methyl-D-erythritol kinase [Candidatus Cloacimonadota bacterium]MBT4334037.1 4-(cytidine 5'-diphospho)-2-C-methyl-D-erythritol kinase [Candidatus Cloacimonadota bacterium]MBT5420101.1 4-(cytidine 5'-diphospho)-2-C-methyl-D-erythritol kinase [Candidatus Cloacimonadota bacterium]
MKKKNLRISSSAKINLFLDVLAKRPDGYHQIRTIFSEIGLADILNFALTKKGSVKILSDRDFVSVKENLIYKVAVFIKEKYNVKFGVEINLQKIIPISAGMGGGSSNAASTIMALSELWDLDLPKEEMHEIAKNFGSDINFFLEGGCALGENRGEKISYLKQIQLDNIFLVNPGFGVSSKEAYDAVLLDNHENNNWTKLIEEENTLWCFNKLQEGVSKKFPEIKKILEHLLENGAEQAILSGSGATVIGFCPDRITAEKFSEHYSDIGYWNYITKTKGVQNEHYRC